MKILYPKVNARLMGTKLLCIKQTDFVKIKDYYNKIADAVVEYSFMMELSKRETERKLEEAFFNGLGRYTSIEIYKLGMQEESVKEILEYLCRFEEGILIQGKLGQLKISKSNSTTNNQEFKDHNSFDGESNKPNLWCKFHRSKSHATKDCMLNPKNKRTSKTDDKEKPKNLVIKEYVDDELSGKVCLATSNNNKEEAINIFNLYKRDNLKFLAMKCNKAKFNTTNNIDIIQSKGYVIPNKYLKDARAEINRLLKEDIIELSNSQYSSPAFFILKKNKDLRLVVDYRKINKFIIDDPWEIPKIDDCLMNIGKKKVFSQIDLKNGFNQIIIDDESKKFTAFTLLGRQWQYKRIPFGIKPGPKIFQRCISNILSDIPEVFVYIDDIVLYSDTEEEHKILLEKVLRRLYDAEVKINFEKSKFFVSELDILGYIVREDGIYPKIIYLENNIFSKDIRTKKDLQRLLGVLNWYRKFIPKLSQKIFRLTEQLKNSTRTVQVSQEMKEEINGIKKFLKENAKLNFPDYSKKFMLQCDASDIGIGAVLFQEDRIIGYYSKKLQGSELNYTIVEKEYLAILLSMLHFKQIVQGYYTEIQSDSNNCRFDGKIKSTSRINRWRLLMNDFDFNIVHIKGDSNVIADGLSRCFYSTQDPKKVEYDRFVESCILLNRNNGEFVKDKYGRIVIKRNRIKSLLKHIHESYGHRGISTIYNNLKNYYFIENIIRNIKQTIKNCAKCKKFKIFNNRNRNKNNIIAEKLYERISTDIYGPFNLENFKTNLVRETGYILSITDIYSRYTKLFFYERVTSNEVIKSYEKWIKCTNTIPKYIISDNGKQYASKEVKDYATRKRIELIYIPEYTPSANGISERLNQIITFGLSVSKDGEIDEITKEIENSININYNRTIKSSPYTLCYKNDFFDISNRNIDKQILKPKVLKNANIKVGDIVYKRCLTAGKLDRKYGGKRKVKKVGRKGSWVLLENDRGWTHIKHLKPVGGGSMWY